MCQNFKTLIPNAKMASYFKIDWFLHLFVKTNHLVWKAISIYGIVVKMEGVKKFFNGI
jgi:hypothetical protein